jgi:hypothetical protein
MSGARLHIAVDDLDANEAAATQARKAVRKSCGAEAEKQVGQDRQREGKRRFKLHRS